MRCVLLCASLWVAIQTTYCERSVCPRISRRQRMSESWKQKFVAYLEESTSATPLVREALAVKEQNLPARIYKYRCNNSYTRTSLESDCVWTCSPAKYNDPYD